jgi:hypothetical protein
VPIRQIWPLQKRSPAPAKKPFSIIPALGRPRQEDHKFKVSLGSTARLCLKKYKQSKCILHHLNANINKEIFWKN